MDFAYRYTPEQECFRHRVEAFLDSQEAGGGRWEGPNADSPGLSLGRIRSLKRRLGGKGWLLPTLTQDRAASGLTQPCRLILWEELEKRGLLPVIAEAGWSLAWAISRWGTAQQADALLPALGKGTICFWRYKVGPTPEPESVELTVEATEDGDEYVLNGEGMFVGLAPSPDYLWTLARLQRGADSRETVTASFLVPAGRKGITLATSRRLIDGTENPVQFSEVRVPRSCMLGQEGNGWLLMGSSALEEQALRHPQRSEETVEALLRYADETCRDGLALSEQQVYQQVLMEAYTNSRLLRLYRTRDAWIRDSGSAITYQEAQTRLWERRTALRLAEIVREVVGLYALLDDRDPRSPATGKFEAQQRKSLALNSQAIEMEGDMNAVARQLGLGRRREEGPGGPSADVSPGVRVPR